MSKSFTFASMKYPARLFVLVVLLLQCLVSFTQPAFPDAGKLYTLDEVPRIDIIIHPDSLKEIYDFPESNREYKAVFVFKSSGLHDTVYDIGFRLRGNTSRYSNKKSFKVSFNTFTKGGKFEGVEKLNLNGEHNDPSSSRAIIYWYILRKAGVAGARANHVQVFINNNYYGLYTNVEHIDEEFVNTYYGNKKGNLYKCLWPADLTWLGPAQSEYKYMNGDHRAYELKINEQTDDYSDLVNFIKTINLTSANQLECETEKIFNVQDYLKVVAVDVMTGNWDGYIYNKNNFYLYNNPSSGLIEYIPYDVDNTFGIDWFDIDWASRNIYNWASEESRPLYKRLMLIPDYKSQYTHYIRKVAEIITSDDVKDFIQLLKIRTRPYLQTDPYYPLDYGYSIHSFDQCWESGTGGHIPIGIVPFLEQRAFHALNQCTVPNAAPAISYISNNTPIGGEDLVITARVDDDDLNSVIVRYMINDAPPVLTFMNDDGADSDKFAGDGIYTAVLKDIDSNSVVDYYIYAYDKHQVRTEKPCTAMSYTYPAQSLPESFAIWPNPASGNFLYLKDRSPVELYDLTGRLLFSISETNEVNISTLVSGAYILKFGNNQAFKVIISH